MAASILLRNIGGTDDKRLVLSNDQAGRLIGIGSTWDSLRIGMRCAINPNGLTTSIISPTFYFGLCSGTTNMAGSATTDNFLGMMYRSGSYNQVYTAGPPVYYTGPTNLIKRVGTTNTGAYYLTLNLSGAPASIRNCILVEITRGSPNYTIGVVYPNSVAAQTDLSQALFLEAMEAGSMASAASVLPATYNASSTTVAFTEATGALNAVNIVWGLSSRPFEISDVAYARIA